MLLCHPGSESVYPDIFWDVCDNNYFVGVRTIIYLVMQKLVVFFKKIAFCPGNGMFE